MTRDDIAIRHLLAVARESAKQLRSMGETAHSHMLDRAIEDVRPFYPDRNPDKVSDYTQGARAKPA